MISAPGSPNIRMAKNIVTLPPGTTSTCVGRDLDAVAAVQIGRHRLAQRQDAVGRRVAVMAVGQRLAPGLDDVLGGREIGLADAEIDDRAALRRQRVGARQHLECGLGAEHRHPAGHLQHACSPLGAEL